MDDDASRIDNRAQIRLTRRFDRTDQAGGKGFALEVREAGHVARPNAATQDLK